jgi:hypothetical protein
MHQRDRSLELFPACLLDSAQIESASVPGNLSIVLRSKIEPWDVELDGLLLMSSRRPGLIK